MKISENRGGQTVKEGGGKGKVVGRGLRHFKGAQPF